MISVGTPGTPEQVAVVGTFKFNPKELSEPGPGEKGLFDWQNPARLDDYGGVPGIAAGLNSDVKNGLTKHEASTGFHTRISHFGSNKKAERPKLNYFELIWEGLHDFTLIVLILASVFSIILGVTLEDPSTGWIEGAAILVAVGLVVNVAAINDLQKDAQFRELQKLNDAKYNKVIRDGIQEQVLADDVQVGDIMYLEYGDQCPADCIFISGSNVKVDEAAMTGESDLAKKSPEKPFLISGTALSEGFCRVIVVSVGTTSVQGKAMALLADTGAVTPLQVKLEKLATQISKLGFVIGCFCVVVMVIRHLALHYTDEGTVDENGKHVWASSNYSSLLSFFIIGITILVVAIPEGLPLAVTIALAYSVKRMMTDKNLVRHLDACETMGGATTICSDKTGTLTQNKMKVVQAYVYSSPASVSFLSRFTTGKEDEYADFVASWMATPDHFRTAVCDNAALNSTASYDPTTDKWIGSKTEIALVELASKLGGSREASVDACPVQRSFPFTSSRKRSSVVVRRRGASADKPVYRVFVKGASEVVLRLCTKVLNATSGEVENLPGNFSFMEDGGVQGEGAKGMIAGDAINSMANKALRTIALAYRDLEGPVDLEEMVEYSKTDNKGEGPCPAVEDGLVLLGIVGIQDPVRPEVPDAVRECQSAGIVVRMVTGDNIATAKAIAVQCNIYHESVWMNAFGEERPAGNAIEGEKFRNLVGGLALPPHFDHECRCKDLSGDTNFRAGFSTAAYPKHYGYPSIIGHTSEQCAAYAREAVLKRGMKESKVPGRGQVPKCTDECRQRGCRELMDEQYDDKYKMVKNQAVFDEIWPTMEVMARSTPTDKHLLVSGLMERGQVVAVTGDGTNDGPALKKANVGFAMGIAGTEVAKEACDIILMDDNFLSIVKAVSWGRNVYDSIRKFLAFQLTVNVVALYIASIGALVIAESPLRAIQMLWVNLIMDTFASLALATEVPTPDLLKRKPYGRDESLVSRPMLRSILGHALYQCGILTWIVFYGNHIFDTPLGRGLGHSALPTQHFTMVFHSFVMMQVFNEINARKIANERNVFAGMFTNHLFPTIIVFTIVVQFLLVIFGGVAMEVMPLTVEMHVAAVVIGFFAMLYNQAILFVSSELFIAVGEAQSFPAMPNDFTKRSTIATNMKAVKSAKVASS